MAKHFLSTFVLLGMILLIELPSIEARSSPPPQSIPPGQTRPRRANRQGEMPPPPPEEAPLSKGGQPAAKEELQPTIRVALAVDVKSAALTCSEPLLWLDEKNQQTVSLGERAVHVMLQRSNTYHIQLTASGDRGAVEKAARKLRAELKQPVSGHYDGQTKQAVVRIGQFDSTAEANAIVRRVRRYGYREVRLVAVPHVAAASPMLVARTPSGENLVESESKLTFASPSADVPLKYDGKAYRGRIILLRNRRNLLTVINELPLESYLLGVVPNELSPSTFGELEALKAQAVAARTYAVANRGKYQTEGFDLLADARSQVYGGKESEHPLATRAVLETWGLIATYDHEPIDAVYTSTCGGRTEDSEAIFGKSHPYLRSVVCAPEKEWLLSRRIESRRSTSPDRTLALLSVAGLSLPSKVTADYLLGKASSDQVREWVKALANALGRPTAGAKPSKRDLTVLAGFSALIVQTFYPEGYADALLSPVDVLYLLDFSDAREIPTAYRSSVALLVRDGIIAPFPDGTLRPTAPLSREYVLTALGRLLDRFDSTLLRSGTIRHVRGPEILIRSPQGELPSFILEKEAFIYKQVAGLYVPAQAVLVVGGERIRFHVNSRGRIDHLEIEPSKSGVASDRYSPFSRWEVTISRAALSGKVREAGISIGRLIDLKIVERGVSGRVIELDLMGTRGKKRLQGQSIRTLLGLRDSLFVVDRKHDPQGHGVANLFLAVEPLRGWRKVRVTDRRTRRDFAEQLRLLADEDYPHVQRIVLVVDNLNTHGPAALYETFEPEEAHRLAARFEWHYTPEHGSWLNIAECELSVLATQCLDQRIPDKETLPAKRQPGKRAATRRVSKWCGSSPPPMPESSSGDSIRL